ncbi:hypothetical protein [Methanoculleus bourgensis]|uniref:Uncharacterized protein n=1 Tax=Methanoculleus bourgensis TaxID=83986 RepID=A0A0X3BQ55_9EURY|nr:hypothetical protein [Methanoculleus bourgensis]CVK34059.1 exported protein of unknown function [Methanoculleus bourgensis]
MALQGLTAWRAYLYAVSLIALVVVIVGAVDLIAIAIEVFIYPAPQPTRHRSTTPVSRGAWRRSWWGSLSGRITGG